MTRSRGVDRRRSARATSTPTTRAALVRRARRVPAAAAAPIRVQRLHHSARRRSRDGVPGPCSSLARARPLPAAPRARRRRGRVLAAFAVHWTRRRRPRGAGHLPDAADDSAQAVRVELARSEDALRGLRGLFVASDSVRRNEFRRYVGALELPRRLSEPARRDLHRLGAVPATSSASSPRSAPTARRSSRVRRAPSDAPAGVARARSPHRHLHEPAETSNVKLGFEVSRRADRARAQDRSRDTGGATLTAASR